MSEATRNTQAQHPAQDEVEVEVRQINQAASEGDVTPVAEIIRRLVLAAIGMVAVTYEEIERFMQRLVEQGELAQRDSEKIMGQVMEQLRKPQQSAQPVQQQAQDMAGKFESGLEQFLNRLNIPSQHDIDELSSRIAQLTARVEELRRQQEQPRQASAGTSETDSPAEGSK